MFDNMLISKINYYTLCLISISFNLTFVVFCKNLSNLQKVDVHHHVTEKTDQFNKSRNLNETQGRGLLHLLGGLLPPLPFPPFGPIRGGLGLSVVVYTNSGRLRGFKKVSRSGNFYWNFAGIPYARPPLGDLRFEPPQPHPGWQHVRNSKIWGPPCMQGMIPRLVFGQEDCLTLNVASRIVSSDRMLPVMVFIHGGAFMTGASQFYPAWYFMDEEVVFVTVNYRLSSLGFLNTGDGTVTGNMGLKDQALALKWVKANIMNFNGDPENILIMGESAGSACVHLHILSPMSRGLFSKAISQSGTALSPWAINRDPKEQFKDLAHGLGCSKRSTKAMISCLKKVPAIRFARYDQHHLSDNAAGKNSLFRPSIEVDSPEPFLSKKPSDILKSGDFAKVPYITGVNSGEGLLYMIAMSQNKTLRDYVNKNWPEIGKFLFNLKEFSSDPDGVISALTHFYMKDKNFSQKNFKYIIPFMSDAGFFLDNHDVALLHSRVAPAYAYHYKYNGIFALGHILFTKTPLPIGDSLNSILGGGVSLISSNLLNSRAENPWGVCHADELALQFNLPFARKPIILADADLAFSKKFVALWASFAETGKPQVSKAGQHGFEWESVKATNPNLEDVALTRLELNDEFSLVKEPFFERLKFWKKLGVTHL